MQQGRNFTILSTWDVDIQRILYQTCFIPFQVSKPLVVFNVSLEPVTFATLKDYRLITACIILRRIVVLLYRPWQRFRNEAVLTVSPLSGTLVGCPFLSQRLQVLMFIQLYVFTKEVLIEIVSLSSKATVIIVWLLVA